MVGALSLARGIDDRRRSKMILKHSRPSKGSAGHLKPFGKEQRNVPTVREGRHTLAEMPLMPP
jgi:hypothetical protein